MQPVSKISIRQATLLIMFFTIGTTILIIPSGLAADAKQDAWIAAVAGTAMGMLVVLLYSAVSKYMADKTMVEYNRELFGQWLGSLISLMFVCFTFIGSATLLFYVGNFLNTHVLINTPIEFINILFVVIIVMGLRLGIETIARAAEVFFPWFFLLFIVLVTFLLPETKIENLQPVLGSDLKSIFRAGLSFAGTAFLTMVTLFMVFPAYVKNREKLGKALFIGTSVGSVCMILVTLLSISVLGAESTARHMYPTYALARKINIGNFFQRIEAILAGMWFFSIYFKITLYSYACVTGLAQILKLKDYRPLTLPFGMILVVYSLEVYPNVVYMAEWDSTVFLPYVLSFGLLLPLVIAATAAWRTKRSGKKQGGG